MFVGFPGPTSVDERAALLTAAREAGAFVAYRDGFGDLRILCLDQVGGERIRIGRTEDNEICLPDNLEVSRAHAVLQAGGAGWGISDDGLSRNGTFVNGERVGRFRRLNDQDLIRIGTTTLLFQQAGVVSDQTTAVAGRRHQPNLTPAERRVLVELCRPMLAGRGIPTPSGNQEIADALVLSLAGVKSHIRSLFSKFEVGDMPQNHKRAELAHRALQLGIVTDRDLAGAH